MSRAERIARSLLSDTRSALEDFRRARAARGLLCATEADAPELGNLIACVRQYVAHISGADSEHVAQIDAWAADDAPGERYEIALLAAHVTGDAPAF